MMYVWKYESPLGNITVAGKEAGLSGLWIEGQKYFKRTLPEVCVRKEISVFKQTKEWLDLYFEGKNPDFMPAFELKGSEFQLAVWNILMEIPYGCTVTYGEIAKRVAKQRKLTHMSAQAVGGAVGHNPISILIPCHRVVGTNGSLTGYAGGIEKKITLLTLEGVNMDKFFVPGEKIVSEKKNK